MPQHHRSGLLRRSALAVCLLGAVPLSLTAQIRRPDPVPAGRSPSRAGVPKRRTEVFATAGTQALSTANATKGSMLIGSVGVRRQFSPEWLMVGGVVDLGSTTVNGEYFPYEKRLVSDTTRFVSVDGRARIISARLTADAIVPFGESKRLRYGGGVSAGVYSVMPTPAGGESAGSFVAPTFAFTGIGEADLTRRLGATVSVGLTQFLGFKREKLRPSDSALEDAVFATPFTQPPAAKSSFGGLKFAVGLTYRLGVKPVPGGKK